ncbi:MAG: neutral/alkaline non-lysosomal ceramidase N-terminal domain-containing protein [Cytophagales bacterium]|nr:neutral/alkaline non-lysosomal ceramidase N-terminal domain-containing protein [Cytophagales bacterium]
MKFIGLFIFFTGLLLVALGLLLFKPIDKRHYKEQDFYSRQLQAIEQQAWTLSQNTCQAKAGWAKVPIVPAEPIAMAGYGISRGAFERVHDSLYVYAIAWQCNKQWFAIVSADLLIFPPSVATWLQKHLLPLTGILFENALLTATHTHSGIGGWAGNLAGKLMAGGYRHEVVRMICQAVIAALQQAQRSASHLSYVAFDMVNLPGLMSNRLSKKRPPPIDGYLRCLQFIRRDSARAMVVAYQAHAICVHPRLLELSRDYPGYLIDSLIQSRKVEFALFASGMVASHVPNYNWGLDSYELARDLGTRLAVHAIDLVKSTGEPLYKSGAWQIPLYLGDPQLRITDHTVLRPEVFNLVFGKQPLYLSVMRLNNLLILGLPCDISGEFASELMAKAANKKLHLLITSFNGGYVGYITPDEYYHYYAPETREMNWTGPHKGAYFVEIISRVIECQTP